jgi:hypothetical protein
VRLQEPKRKLMILSAYFDESGTHKGAELSVMAGFVGDAGQWRKFEKRAGKLFRRFGVDVFHSIDVRRSDKDFSGWTVDRKIEFMDEFHHIINETVERGFSSILRNDDYDYYVNREWPRGARKDSRYGLLFRASLSSVVDSALAVERWAFGREPKLNVILESGHRNAPDAVRLYEFFCNRYRGQSKALSGLAFETKQQSLPLAAADLFAYSAYGKEVGAKPIGVPKKPIKSDASYKGNLYRIVLERETLDALHQQAIMFAAESVSAGKRSASIVS